MNSYRIFRTSVLFGFFFICLPIISLNSFAKEPSFKCYMAKSNIEKWICESDSLSDLDRLMDYRYQKLNQALDKKSRKSLKEEQMSWIQQRAEKCEHNKSIKKGQTCLEELYRDRNLELRKQLDKIPEDKKLKAEEALKKPGEKRFYILKGKENCVCKAYKERLNTSYFKVKYNSSSWPMPPYCDRPENDAVEGFKLINRSLLTPEEVYKNKYYDKVVSFLLHSDQYNGKKVKHGKYLSHTPKGTSMETIKLKMSVRQFVFQLCTQVDIDNDGDYENLLIWRRTRCNDESGPRNFACVLSKEMGVIDENKTSQIFRRKGDWTYDNFPYIGASIGVFQFKEKYYFDTFPGGFVYPTGKKTKTDLIVYKHENGKNEIICEFDWR